MSLNNIEEQMRLKEQESKDAAEANKRASMFASIGDNLSNRTSVGEIMLNQRRADSHALSDLAKSQAVADPMEKYKNTLATYTTLRDAKKSEQDSNPESQRNIAMKTTLENMYPGRSFDGYTVADHDRYMDPLKLRETIDARKDHDRLWASARSGSASTKEDMAQAREDEKLRRYTNVGGWTLDEGATPTLDDAKKFKSGVSDARGLLDNLNKYQDLVSKKGSEYFGKNAQDMESLARDIQLSAKGEGLYGLGVLSGPDLNLLEEIIKAPTGMVDQFNPIAGSRAANKAQQFREMLNTRINAKAKTYGFSPKEDWNALAQSKPQATSGMMGASEAVAAPMDNKAIFTDKDEQRLRELEAKHGRR